MVALGKSVEHFLERQVFALTVEVEIRNRSFPVPLLGDRRAHSGNQGGASLTLRNVPARRTKGLSNVGFASHDDQVQRVAGFPVFSRSPLRGASQEFLHD